MIKFQKLWCTHRICNNCGTEEEVREIKVANFNIALCKKCRNELKELLEGEENDY